MPLCMVGHLLWIDDLWSMHYIRIWSQRKVSFASTSAVQIFMTLKFTLQHIFLNQNSRSDHCNHMVISFFFLCALGHFGNLLGVIPLTSAIPDSHFAQCPFLCLFESKLQALSKLCHALPTAWPKLRRTALLSAHGLPEVSSKCLALILNTWECIESKK